MNQTLLHFTFTVWSTFVHAAPLSSASPSLPSSPSSQSGAPTADKAPLQRWRYWLQHTKICSVTIHTGAPHSVVGVEGFQCSCMGVMLILLCVWVCVSISTASLYMRAMTEQLSPFSGQTGPLPMLSSGSTVYALLYMYCTSYDFIEEVFQYDRFCTLSWVHSCSNCTVCSEHVNFVDVLFEAVCCSAKCDHWTTCNRWGVYDI